jgi:hypothetical protein
MFCMKHWIELGLLVLTVGGVVQGYLRGVRRTGVVVLVLLLVFLASRSFGEAGAEYLTLYHHLDVKIMPVLLDRLPLVITVSPLPGIFSEPAQRAAVVVENMPLVPVYQNWLTGLPEFTQGAGGSTGQHMVAQVFSQLLLKRGIFLFFFGVLLLGAKIAGEILGQGEGVQGGFGDKLAGALLGGCSRLMVLAVALTALAPFFPLFFSFLAWDVAKSPVVQFLVKQGLYFLPAL